MQVTEHVHAVPISLTFDGEERVFHPAFVETPRGVLLVDVGFPQTLEQLEAALADAGYGFDAVTAVLLTHQDGDHAAALEAVGERTDAPVLAHVEAAPYIDGREAPIKGDPDERYPPVPVDIEIVDGVTFRTDAGPVRTVATPGHSPGHVSLYLPEERLLIAADALTGSAAGELEGPSAAFTPDMERAMESVARLGELEIERTLCYHGGLIEAGTDRIREIAATEG